MALRRVVKKAAVKMEAAKKVEPPKPALKSDRKPKMVKSPKAVAPPPYVVEAEEREKLRVQAEFRRQNPPELGPVKEPK